MRTCHKIIDPMTVFWVKTKNQIKKQFFVGHLFIWNFFFIQKHFLSVVQSALLNLLLLNLVFQFPTLYRSIKWERFEHIFTKRAIFRCIVLLYTPNCQTELKLNEDFLVITKSVRSALSFYRFVGLQFDEKFEFRSASVTTSIFSAHCFSPFFLRSLLNSNGIFSNFLKRKTCLKSPIYSFRNRFPISFSLWFVI